MGRPKKYKTEEERKAAHRASSKRYSDKHKNEIAAYKAAYDAAHKDEIAEYKAAYRAVHKEELAVYMAEYNAEYYAEHKEELAAKNAEYYTTMLGRATKLVCGYRRNDKKYNRGECTITPEWILDNVFNSTCTYCGESDWKLLGVDRKDSSLPHTPENCVPCCKSCNKKKSAIPYDEYMRRIGKIA